MTVSGQQNCEDVSGETSVFLISFLLTKINARENAKMWGRLRPIVHFWKICSVFFFMEKISAERTRNCEDVSGQSSIFVFLFSFYWKNKRRENAKLWGRLTPNASFPQKKMFHKFERETGSEIVRTSQANRSFLFFEKKKSAGENAKLWGRLTPNARFPQQKNKTFLISLQI